MTAIDFPRAGILKLLGTAQIRVLFALLACVAVTAVSAEDLNNCMTTAKSAQPESPDLSSATITLGADRADIRPDGTSLLEGDVSVSYQNRMIRADAASYDANTGAVNVDGEVELSAPNLSISGGRAQFSSLSDAGSFEDARFELLDRNGRGDAKKIEVSDNNRLTLRDVRYTACPEGQNDWRFISPELVIDREKQIGAGRNVRVEFKGVPILYAPYISFPVGEARKSGFLLPDFSSNDRSGRDFALPYYWNIAPNYDALITTRHLSKRGAQLGAETRYLFSHSNGVLSSDFLPNDDLTNEDRVR